MPNCDLGENPNHPLTTICMQWKDFCENPNHPLTTQCLHATRPVGFPIHFSSEVSLLLSPYLRRGGRCSGGGCDSLRFRSRYPATIAVCSFQLSVKFVSKSNRSSKNNFPHTYVNHICLKILFFTW